MEIRIGSYIAASFLLEQEPKQWHALVILDSDKYATDFLQTHTLSHHCLKFDDLEVPRTNKQTPTMGLIEQGLAFAKGKDKLLVCCRAGQGRSVAMAYVIACREHGVEDALKLLNPTRHRPNRLVVSLGNTLMDSVDLLREFDEWRRRHSHIQLSDYFDEMEKELVAIESQGAVNKICVS